MTDIHANWYKAQSERDSAVSSQPDNIRIFDSNVWEASEKRPVKHYGKGK